MRCDGGSDDKIQSESGGDCGRDATKTKAEEDQAINDVPRSTSQDGCGAEGNRADESSLSSRLIRIEQLLSSLKDVPQQLAALKDVPQQLAALNESQQQMRSLGASAKQVSDLSESLTQLGIRSPLPTCASPLPLAERFANATNAAVRSRRPSGVGFGRSTKRTMTGASSHSSQAGRSVVSGERTDLPTLLVLPAHASSLKKRPSGRSNASSCHSIEDEDSPKMAEEPLSRRNRLKCPSSKSITQQFTDLSSPPSERVFGSGDSPQKVPTQQSIDLPVLDLPGSAGSDSPAPSSNESPRHHLPRRSSFPNGSQGRRGGPSQLSLGGGAAEEMMRSAAALADLRHLVEARPAAPLFVLLPNDPRRLCLDVLVVLATLLAGFLVPLGITYLEPGAISEGALGRLVQMIECIFALDIFANLRTGFVNVDRLELRPRHIAVRYLRRGLVPDILSVWPAALMPHGGEHVLLGLKLSRLSRLMALIAKIQKETHWKALAPLRIVIVVFLLCHILSCAWRLMLRADGSERAERWQELYVEDAYWVLMTMTTVGYGDISPGGTTSRLFALLSMLIAPMFFGSIVSALTHITRGLFENRTEELVAEVTAFMRERRLPTDIQQRVQRNLRNHLQKEHSKALDPKLFALLSPSMQRDFSLALVSSTVLQFPLFRGAQHSFVAELAQAHSWVECLPGDVVAEEGQLVQEVVFVILGRLAMQSPPEHGCEGSREVEIETGAWFGEESLFGEGCVRAGTIVAIVESELAVLRAREYHRIVRKYPRLMEKHRSIESALISGALSLEELAWRRPPGGPFHMLRSRNVTLTRGTITPDFDSEGTSSLR